MTVQLRGLECRRRENKPNIFAEEERTRTRMRGKGEGAERQWEKDDRMNL